MSWYNVHPLYIYFVLNYFRYICFQNIQHIVLLENTLLWIYQNEITNIHDARPIWLLHIQYLINYPNYLGQNMLNLVLQCFYIFFIEESWLNDLINEFIQCASIVHILCIELFPVYLFPKFTAYCFVGKHIIMNISEWKDWYTCCKPHLITTHTVFD